MKFKDNYDSYDEAIKTVIEGNSWAAVSIPTNFSRCLKTRIRVGADTRQLTINCSTIRIHADMSNAVIGLSLTRTVFESMEKFVMNYLAKSGYNPSAISRPITTQEVVYGVEQPSIQDFMAPGMVFIYLRESLYTSFKLCHSFYS